MIEIHQQGSVTVCALDQAYDSLDSRQLDELDSQLCTAVSAAKDSGQEPLMVIDLSHTNFIGSSFLEVLFRAWKQIKENNGRLALCGLSEFCQDVMKTTKLDSLWSAFPTRQAAVEALNGGE